MLTNDSEVMQVCGNGHVLSPNESGAPVPPTEFCPVCGAKALSACPACNEPLRYRTQPLQRLAGALGFGEFERPRHCAKCGTVFPWQEQAVQFLKDIGREASLSKDDLAIYDRAVDDVAQNNTRAPRSAGKILAMAVKAGKPAQDEAAKLIREIATKEVRQTLSLSD